MTNIWTLYVDGLNEPRNPGGKACYGWVVYDEKEEIARGYGFIAEHPGTTNNIAEYTALIKGINAIRDLLDITKIQLIELKVRGDSQLVINQINGGWELRSPKLKPLFGEAVDAIGKLKVPVTFEWVRREQNQRADDLSNIAYREARKGVLKAGSEVRSRNKFE